MYLFLFGLNFTTSGSLHGFTYKRVAAAVVASWKGRPGLWVNLMVGVLTFMDKFMTTSWFKWWYSWSSWSPNKLTNPLKLLLSYKRVWGLYQAALHVGKYTIGIEFYLFLSVPIKVQYTHALRPIGLFHTEFQKHSENIYVELNKWFHVDLSKVKLTKTPKYFYGFIQISFKLHWIIPYTISYCLVAQL